MDLDSKPLTLDDLRHAARVVARTAQLSRTEELARLSEWLWRYVELAEMAMAVPEEHRDQFLAALGAKDRGEA